MKVSKSGKAEILPTKIFLFKLNSCIEKMFFMGKISAFPLFFYLALFHLLFNLILLYNIVFHLLHQKIKEVIILI